MKFFKYVLSLQLILFSAFAQAQAKEDEITREQRADKIYEELFTAKRGDSPDRPGIYGNPAKAYFWRSI